MRLCIIFGQGRVCGMIWGRGGKVSGVREGGGAMGEGNGGVVVFDGEGSGMDTPRCSNQIVKREVQLYKGLIHNLLKRMRRYSTARVRSFKTTRIIIIPQKSHTCMPSTNVSRALTVCCLGCSIYAQTFYFPKTRTTFALLGRSCCLGFD